MKKNNHINNYFAQIGLLSNKINKKQVEQLVKILVRIRKRKGRVFFLGVGGSAGNCSHAVNDFRKICEIECYTPTDNVSELTARINDDGWESSFANWLKISNLNSKDAIFVMSVGGGNKRKKVSVNLIKAIEFSKSRGAKVLGIVGKDGGHTNKFGDLVILIPTVDDSLVTPYCESFQSLLWHCLISHPLLQIKKMKDYIQGALKFWNNEHINEYIDLILQNGTEADLQLKIYQKSEIQGLKLYLMESVGYKY